MVVFPFGIFLESRPSFQAPALPAASCTSLSPPSTTELESSIVAVSIPTPTSEQNTRPRRGREKQAEKDRTLSFAATAALAAPIEVGIAR